MTDAEFLKLPEPPPTLQLETATPEELTALRIRFTNGDYAQIGELDHG